jgi:DEAD/DEAH box helicase domain-containing protein
VERLDFKERKAYVKRVNVDYFTQAISYTQVKILEDFASERKASAVKNHGEVLVRRQVVGFKKIKFFTLENVGSGELQLPENEFHTTSYWLTLPRDFYASLGYSVTQRQNGVSGLLNAMQTVASLLLMCDERDLGRTIEENFPAEETASEGRPQWFEPNLHLFDNYPGGIGLSKPLYGMHDELLKKTRELIAGCNCTAGCPSCVGPFGETGEGAKEVALAILDQLCGEEGNSKSET